MRPEVTEAQSKINSTDVEVAVAKYFNYRQNLIVPNVFWGWKLRHEADIIVLRPSGWATEIEIKLTSSDIKADLLKRYNHWESSRIQQCFVAVPNKLHDIALRLVPVYCGVLEVYQQRFKNFEVVTLRGAKRNPKARKISPEEKQKLAELGAMRIWDLKQALRVRKAKKVHE